MSARKNAAIATEAGVSAPGSGACWTSMRTPRAARLVTKAESAGEEAGRRHRRRAGAVGERQRDGAVGEPDLLHLAAVDVLEELGERELRRRRLAAADVDPGGDQAADSMRAAGTA